MIDKLPANADAQPLNSYNVAQLQFALEDPKNATLVDPLSFDVRILDTLSGSASPAAVHTPDVDVEYSERRMSSSVDSDTGSLHSTSRPEKRALSPTDSPDPKKSRPDTTLGPTTWSTHGSESDSPQPQQHDDISYDHSPRVQLPSIASTFHDRHELRRASLPTLWSESSATRLRLPAPSHRPTQSTTGLSSYAFPPNDAAATGADDRLSANHRPRLAADTQLGLYPSEYSLSSTLSSSSSFGFPPLSAEYKSTDDHWATGIVRPNSSPGQISPTSGLKYDDTLRHSQQLFGGITRIAGHSHHLTDRHGRIIKSEHDWNFPNDFTMSSSPSASGLPSAASQSMSGSPSRSPQQPQGTSVSSLVERPPRKRGKLPKPVTDFLKDWLHRHSDHPYPSEEEKKQLCHATGLSMSQVSNWMINQRFSPPVFSQQPPFQQRWLHERADERARDLESEPIPVLATAPAAVHVQQFDPKQLRVHAQSIK
ncbi:hypothetical protein EUX98_g6161 [Antrodiella citrinella]|uniref:Homeobox domain-containing protein n=1 Tax=Antrodiella citrinella TaxID=2447956 RepID=A0A4S4MPZ8_9APHY|nr:hypothetical protein EUX98_g6161 [Antrodiella citrinella]